MEISLKQFRSRERAYTQECPCPWANAFYPWVKGLASVTTTNDKSLFLSTNNGGDDVTWKPSMLASLVKKTFFAHLASQNNGFSNNIHFRPHVPELHNVNKTLMVVISWSDDFVVDVNSRHHNHFVTILTFSERVKLTGMALNLGERNEIFFKCWRKEMDKSEKRTCRACKAIVFTH